MAAGQQGDDAVGFTEFGRTQHDAFVTIQRHKRFLPFIAYPLVPPPFAAANAVVDEQSPEREHQQNRQHG